MTTRIRPTGPARMTPEMLRGHANERPAWMRDRALLPKAPPPLPKIVTPPNRERP